MKILFLDFDGVIRISSEELGWEAEFVYDKLKLVEQICINTGAKIVISSDWRMEANVLEMISSLVPYLHEDWKTPVIGPRWKEIDEWLGRNLNVRQFVILDDFTPHFIGAPKEIKERLIVCSNRHGLQPSQENSILRALEEPI